MGTDTRLQSAVQRLLVRLDRTCGGDVLRSAAAPVAGRAQLEIAVEAPGEAVQSLGEDESYTLEVTPSGGHLSAPTVLGAMHGMETLLQLVSFEDGACVVPAVTIHDAPRFAWRGFMLDVSRHFEPVSEIEHTLDGMAMVKLNVFHWHLSDDQGFRAESRLFPRFTAVASSGEFYTQEQMREVVAYARARGIRVVPEFDVPGHTTSWLLAYPEIGAGEHITTLPVTFGIPQAELDVSSEKTYKFLDAFLGEMAQIFPDAYFHIGGDETEGKGWLDNPRIAAFMKQKGFSKPAELQAYFNQRLLPILARHHKKMIGWDEILNPALPKDVVIQSWRGEASLVQSAGQGYQGLLSAPYYLDGQKTAEEMFLADPVPADTTLAAAQQKLILGGEVCMWSEQVHSVTLDSRVWPRTAAVAERLWSPQADRDIADMYRRLRRVSLSLEAAGLTHISGPQQLWRDLTRNPHPEAMELFASMLEPVSFSDRYQAQKTDRFTSLDRLVDAVVPDPPSRQELAREVDAVLLSRDQEAARRLAARFTAWQHSEPELLSAAVSSPRLSDMRPRVHQFVTLADAGLEALAYLQSSAPPPPGWRAAKLAVIAEAETPVAVVRFTFLPSLRRLVEAAAKDHQQEGRP
ncbi:MAG TPA: family 20 glycosylhydrolase [Acidobacteriaceae bacterium]